jgi:hypothetical protein
VPLELHDSSNYFGPSAAGPFGEAFPKLISQAPMTNRREHSQERFRRLPEVPKENEG